jgi:hypothetical protein
VAPAALLVVVLVLVVLVVLVPVLDVTALLLLVLDDVALVLLVLDDAALLLLVLVDVAVVADTEETDAPHPTRLDWIETSSYQKVLGSLPYDSQPK